jgi:hypothetical protein
MPKFLEDKLKSEYPGDSHAVYGTLNRIGAMHGNKETAKGKAMQAKHDRDQAKKPKKKSLAAHMGAQLMGSA